MLTVDLRAGPGVEPYLPPGASPRVVELVHPSGIVQIKRPKSDPEVLPGPPRWKYFHRAKPEADPEVLPGARGTLCAARCVRRVVRAARSARCAFCALRVLRTKSSNLQTY